MMVIRVLDLAALVASKIAVQIVVMKVVLSLIVIVGYLIGRIAFAIHCCRHGLIRDC